MLDLEISRVVQSLERGQGDVGRLVALLARAGELPCSLPFSFLELEDPPEVREMTFRGQVKWYRDGTRDGYWPSGCGPSPIEDAYHRWGGPPWEILFQASEKVWVHCRPTGRVIRSLKTEHLEESDYTESGYGVFSPRRALRELHTVTPSWHGDYGIKGRPTRIFCYSDGTPLFKTLPLVIHLEDVIFTRIPPAHFSEDRPVREVSDFGSCGIFPVDATYLDEIWLWREEVNQYKDVKLQEERVRSDRVKKGKWETPEELEEVRRRSHSNSLRSTPTTAERKRAQKLREQKEKTRKDYLAQRYREEARLERLRKPRNR